MRHVLIRNIIKLIFLLFTIASVSYSLAAGSIDRFWSGNYEFTDTFWDGTQSVITEIKLKINTNGECTLSREGFQQDEHIICFAQENKLSSSIDILFISYLNGSTTNEYGVAVYEHETRLFSLKITKGNKVMTIWSNSYRPPKTTMSGYFLKKQIERN
ncbi:DUF5991 domain-containing protein [Paraburkholderia pallida]|uniref:Uncharacterized protein n=1 Tax=Paraburkholderia pallida TaxID=2547399 RepID=A0A4P7CVE6_9BURK|nr:DUF5991 domain-containing protein [Paraburkholderia pallida]QBR00136.1 hypothetical protein E1956_23935 [Paraburkholderia pallida]